MSATERDASQPAFRRRLDRLYLAFVLAFAAFVGALALFEHWGLPRHSIGFIFLLATVALYATIGIASRTTDAAEYYVAGRRVPALYNGMATAADWMSAASFISLAGGLYLSGFNGLAFVIGWTGGFVLVALLLAPYLRRFGQYTIPDFLAARYGGHVARLTGAAAAIVCSFTYLVAQIYGVGLITTWLTGLAFEIGVFVGLGGVLLCSFLGGMRAVTWTQVAQYTVLIVAYMIPVVWLSAKHTGNPVPQVAYGQVLAQVTAIEDRLIADPREQEVEAIYAERARVLTAKLQNVPAALASERAQAEIRLAELKQAHAPLARVQTADRALRALPVDDDAARLAWRIERDAALVRAQPLGGLPRHAQAFAGDPDGDPAARAAFDLSRRNFMALVFCLMVGTAALPHILARTYTTPSVREARASVGWTLFFIALLYVTAPALAVLVKMEVFTALIGTPFDRLPDWITVWGRVDPELVSVTDINQDGVLQLGELHLGGDVVVLAAPAIGGLPTVVSGLIAAGGLAAALSTADGLLLTIANALSHDVYHQVMAPNASTARRVAISKSLLLIVAMAAAAVAAYKPADILVLVSSAFSLAAAAFFPALTLGIFWKRANARGAVAGIAAGLAVTLYYMATTQPVLRDMLGVSTPVADSLWWGIQPISAGVFGVALGSAVIVVVSLLTAPPPAEARALVDDLRSPPAER